MLTVAREDPEDVVCLGDRAVVAGVLGQEQSLARELQRPVRVAPPVRDEAAVGECAGALALILRLGRACVMLLRALPVATAVEDLRDLPFDRRARRRRRRG